MIKIVGTNADQSEGLSLKEVMNFGQTLLVRSTDGRLGVANVLGVSFFDGGAINGTNKPLLTQFRFNILKPGTRIELEQAEYDD